MNITQCSDLIAEYLSHDLIDFQTAARAQDAVRQATYYGNRMTGDDRRLILALRFGIVEMPTYVYEGEVSP